MAKLPDRNTVDTLVNVMNNGTAGGFVVGNVSSLYQKGENDSQQVTMGAILIKIHMRSILFRLKFIYKIYHFLS